MTYEQFLEGHLKGHFMQTDAWARVKKDWRQERIIIQEEGEIKGFMSVLIRPVPLLPYTVMYSPRGPVCDITDSATLEKLINQARILAAEHRAYVLKLDPDVECDRTDFVKTMEGLGFRQKSSKNFESIQPCFVFRLDIEGKTEEEVLSGMHSKTRYNINVARKKGVCVSLGQRSDLPRFHEIMLETGLRDGFVIRSLDYFERMYDELGESMRLYIARYEDKIVAGTLAIHFGDKVWYLYGASSNEARNVMPNYLLQWEMIRWAIEKKCRVYDFRGVSGDIDESNPLYGLYRFKKGFGGKLTEFVGELELCFKPTVALLIEKGLSAFIELRRQFFLLKKKKGT